MPDIYGTGGADELHGTAEGEVIWGCYVSDPAWPTDGGDTIYGHGGFDRIFGGPGNDYISMEGTNAGWVGIQSSELAGGTGDDIIHGSLGPDSINGDQNLDVNREGGNDILYGYAGNDWFYGGFGNDIIYGGDGSDVVYFTAHIEWGGDTFIGGEGADYISLASWDGIVISFSDVTISQDGEGFILTVANVGSINVEGVEWLRSESGELYPIRAQLFDNAANYVNFNTFTAADDAFVTQLYAGGSIDGIYNAFSGDDEVFIPLATNSYFGSVFNQSVEWDYTRTFYAGGGVDIVHGSDVGDFINGGDDRDTLYGVGGNDHVYGGEGNDFVSGGPGSDFLFGENGDDTLNAADNSGNLPSSHDELDGGHGADRYVVDDGDSVLVFARNDLSIDFQTSHVVSRVAIVFDGFATEIRAYAADNSFDQTLINFGVAPIYLAAQTFNDAETGNALIRITNAAPTSDLFRFALDQQHALNVATNAFQQMFNEAGWQSLGVLIDETGTKLAEEAIQRSAAVIAGDVAEAVAKQLLERFDFVSDVDDLTEALGAIVSNYLDGKYEGKAYQAAQDLGVALSELLLPAGSEVLFKLGTDFVAEILGDVVIAMSSSTEAYYEQLRSGRTIVPDANANVIIQSGGNTAIYSNGGNDLIIDVGPTQQGATAASGMGTTYNGGTGFDTVAYAVTGAVVVDLAAGLAIGADIGTDTLVSIENVSGGSAADSLTGNAGHNELVGNAGDDRLIGGGGHDRLDGGTGADRLYGGDGNDFYYVDHLSDRAYEVSATGGIDTVNSSVNFVLGANVERLVLSGTLGLRGYGNGLGNVITGNGGNNRLDGKAGADVMSGGLGNDIYYLDSTGDRAIEAFGAGIDVVYSSVNHVLGANVERLVLTGNLATRGYGNDLDNIITGNAGNNIFDGKGGADRMTGGLGNDIYYVDSSGDRTIEGAGAGTDVVYASITHTLAANLERVILTGSASVNATGNALANIVTGNGGANRLVGLDGADTLSGGTGNDQLFGGTGNDKLYGGAGADKFYFDTALAANVDRIMDFSVTDDTIILDQSVFGAFASLGYIGADSFVLGHTAQDENDHILSDASNGRIYYDADGSGAGAAVLFATVAAGTALSASDFYLIG